MSTAIAAWMLAASAAGAATVSEVRVGTHEDGHTRIVVELDSMAGYRLQSPTAGGSPELIVNLDAASISRDVPSKSRVVKKVHVEPSGDAGSTVRISLATGDVAVKETLLANPPRIVFDLKARGPLPKGDVADAEPSEPAEAAASDTEPSPEKVAATPPTPVAPPAPAKVEAKVEVPKSAPVAVAAADTAKPSTPAPTRLTMPSASAPSAPLGDDAMPPPPSTPQPDLEPAPAAAPPAAESAPRPTYIPPIDREKHVAQSAPAAPPAAVTAEARREAIAAKAQQGNQGSGSLVDLAFSPIGMGVLAGAALLLVVIVAMRRRRANEDEDPLYTVMSADDAGAGVSMDDAYPATEADARSPVLSALGPYEPDAYEEASEPVFKPDATGRQLTLSAPATSQPEAEESESPAMLGDDADSIFAAEPEVIASAPPPISIPIPEPVAPPAASQVAQISAEVERRVAELERRLEQLTEARERLERQVAAQTEELRVQRAAIARTQRVVRTIAKTEDMATEPVPRAPSA